MRIIVFNIAASTGGAITILQEFYNKAKADRNNQYTFIVSCDELDDCENIKIVRAKWPKKNWLFRIIFDLFFAARICRQENGDHILSLQNLCVPGCDIAQTVYLHNSIQFSKFKINPFKYPKLYIYRELYKHLVKWTLKKANKVIVQTQWMYDACRKLCDVNKIIIEKPTGIYTRFEGIKKENVQSSSKKQFFYPATPFFYKNQSIIIDAIRLMDKSFYEKFEVYFTCLGNENPYILATYKTVQKEKLPVKFIGNLNAEKMAQMYQNSVLLFPSYLESLGLPLLEARYFGSYIITTTESFSKECAEGYDKCMFFEYNDAFALKDCMCKVIEKNLF